MKAPPSFSTLFSIGPAQESVFGNLTRPQLLKLVRTLCRECRDWVDSELRHCDAGGLTIRPADLAYPGIQVALLHHFVSIEGARVLLPAAEFALVEGDEENLFHLLNEPRGERSGLRQLRKLNEPLNGSLCGKPGATGCRSGARASAARRWRSRLGWRSSGRRVTALAAGRVH